jgi:hypothetical protein
MEKTTPMGVARVGVCLKRLTRMRGDEESSEMEETGFV